MMGYRRKVIALSSVLALLLVSLLLGELFSPDRRLARAEEGRLLSGEPKDAAILEISGPEGLLLFERKEGAWLLAEEGGSLPASASRVESFLSEAASVSRLELRATGRASWPEFGLDGGKGYRVSAKDGKGKSLADFTVGSYGPTGKELFVRLGEAEKSYSAQAPSLASYLAAGRRGWLDLRVSGAPIRPEDVQGVAMRADIALDGPGSPARRFEWRAQRSEGGWKSGAAALDLLALESLLRGLVNLEAEDARAAAPAGVFDRISLRAELSLGTGVTRIYEAGAEAGGGRYYFRRKDSPIAYEVSAYALKNLAKSLSELK